MGERERKRDENTSGKEEEVRGGGQVFNKRPVRSGSGSEYRASDEEGRGRNRQWQKRTCESFRLCEKLSEGLRSVRSGVVALCEFGTTQPLWDARWVLSPSAVSASCIERWISDKRMRGWMCEDKRKTYVSREVETRVGHVQFSSRCGGG